MSREPGRKTPEPPSQTHDRLVAGADDAQIIARLRRVEGQIRAIQRLISEGRDCHLIAQQLSAAKVALGRASVQLMATRMAECMRKDKGVVDDLELKRLTTTFMKVLG